MENTVKSLKAVELAGHIDSQQQLHLDEPVGIQGPTRVRVLILVQDYDEIEEAEWLKALSRNPALDFLHDPAEDIYEPTDGKPFHDKE
ncbi:MAG: hypothetical protein KF749_09730 [Bacteroidetes bacterium]|nr:hypothetical protein [Bacteroidota bacterium]MCW5895027.1 hypothetical protein [Bacteroidota bacterium]